MNALTPEKQKRNRKPGMVLIGNSGLLTVEQLAEHLQITVSGVRKLVAKRRIPACKLGYRTVRFNLSKVEAALEKLTTQSI